LLAFLSKFAAGPQEIPKVNLSIVVVAVTSMFLAYVNGANDVSKGIATLAGSGVSSYRRAILWGTLWTTCGSVAAFEISRALVVTFGKGLLTAGVHPTFSAAMATLVGAGLWVGLASRFGLPVSTTHAIVGSVASVTTLAYGFGGMNWSMLIGKVALPLLLSPFASLFVSAAVLRLWIRISPSGADCLCAEVASPPPVLATTAAAVQIAPLTFPVTELVTCDKTEISKGSSVAFSLTLDHLHWMTSAGASFARGLNDAPKMVAITLAAASLSGFAIRATLPEYLLIALGILAGSLYAGRRVTTVLAEKITRMDHREGFIANLVTSLLVGPGAFMGLPMSTTHVASGAIIGIGVRKDGAIDWQRVKEMVLAWIITLPAAALLGILSYALLHAIRLR
jgi:PiT family inorganic phosphate transporter